MSTLQETERSPERDGGRLLALLDGRACPDCEDGQLERGTYKDNRAVICDSCETPRAQLWRR